MPNDVNKSVDIDPSRDKDDPAEVKRRWLALLDEMEALPGPGRIQEREPIIWRDD